MYGLSRYAGIGPSIRLAGRTFTVHTWTLRDWGAVEAEILHLRGDPCSFLRSCETSEWAMSEVHERVQNDGIWASWREIMDYRDTWSGRVFTLSRSLRLGINEACGLVATECDRRGVLADHWWWSDIQPAINQANCDDELSGIFADDLPKADSDDEAEDESLQWLRMFSHLTREPFSMSVDQVLDLTFWQARAITFRAEDSGGFDSPVAMQAHFRARKERAARAARNLKQGRRYDDNG